MRYITVIILYLSEALSRRYSNKERLIPAMDNLMSNRNRVIIKLRGRKNMLRITVIGGYDYVIQHTNFNL